MTITIQSSETPVIGMTFGQLKTAIANRLGRANLTAIIPDFVTLGEARIYHGFKDIEVQAPRLRIRSMIAVERDSLSSLPERYLEASRFVVPGVRDALSYITPDEFATLSQNPGYPRYYTFQDGGVEVEGGMPETFTFAYYKRFPTLVSDDDTNWLLVNHPGIYLYSALIEAYAHLKDDMRIPTATRMYAAAINALMDSDNADRHSGSVLSIPAGRR